MTEPFKINAKNQNLTLQIIHERVSLGFKLQELEQDELTKEEIVKYNDSIIIAPDYQREYRSTIADESSLVESIMLGIPIPPVFLASNKLKGVQVLNVVDGQHRLRAFYRYFEDSYSLAGLKILSELNDMSFSDLEIEKVTALQSGDIPTITFRDFPGKDFELEIFNRYNKGTKPLTPQEIRHAVYGSRINDLVNDFCKKILSEPKSSLGKAYNISKVRYQKKTCQEGIFVILSIIDKGIDQGLNKSPEFAERYMEEKSELDKNQEKGYFDEAKNSFEEFNKYLTHLTKVTDYPFSREVYGVSRRGNKYQVSISMILAAIFKKMKDSYYNFDLLADDEVINRFSDAITSLILNSHLENSDYKASTTNPVEIKKIVDAFTFE